MINFAGIDLLVSTPEIEDFVNRYLAYQETSLFQVFNNDVCGYYPPSLPNDGRIKLNSLYWPRGAGRFSYGFFLCTTTQLDLINSSVTILGSGASAGSGFGSGNCVCSGSGFSSGASGSGLSGGGRYATASPFVMNTDEESDPSTGINCDLYMLAPIPIARVPNSISKLTLDVAEGLFLITLVDERFFWSMRRPISQTVIGSTWDSIYDNFFMVLSDGTLSDISSSSAYGAMPCQLMESLWQSNMPQVVDCYFYQTQKRLIKYLSGGYVLVGPQEAKTLSFVNSTLNASVMFGGGIRQSNLLNSANDLSDVLYMPHKECSDLRYSIPKGITFIEQDSNGNESYNTRFNPFVSPAQVNRFKSYNMAFPGNNGYYQQFTYDWFEWQRSYLDVCFARIVPYVPTGFEDYIEFHCSKDLSYTKVNSGQKNDLTGVLFNCACESTREIIKNFVESVICISGSGSGSGLQVTSSTFTKKIYRLCP